MSIEKVISIIKNSPCGYLATSVDGQPRIRPMAFVVLDDLRLWSSTFCVSGKVKECDDNAKVEVCFVDGDKVQVRLEGRISTQGGADKKRALLELNPRVRRHFPDENDPNFVHLEIVPTRVRWKGPGFGEYETLSL